MHLTIKVRESEVRRLQRPECRTACAGGFTEEPYFVSIIVHDRLAELMG